MLGANGHWCAFGALTFHGFGEGLVAAGDHVAGGGRALVDEDVLDRLATAHGDAFVDDGLQRQFLAAAHLVVGGDHGHGAGVLNAFLQRLGRETAKHHAVGGTDTGAGLHRDHAFHRHRHVDQHAVTLFHAMCLERIGKLADACQQFLVGDLGDFAAVGFKDDGGLVLVRRAHVLVQAIGGGVHFAVVKPLVERCVGLVEHTGEGLGPDHVFAGQATPEAVEVGFSFLAQRVVSIHSRDTGSFDGGFGRGENSVFDQYGFDRGTHGFCLQMTDVEKQFDA